LTSLQDEIQDIYNDLDSLLSVGAPSEIEDIDEEQVADTIKKTIEILTETVDI
jgi:hypothetical protein